MLPEPLRRVVQMFARLPGVGEKTAQRFALQLMSDESLASELSRELAALVQNVRPCERCGNIAEVDATGAAVCGICSDPRRDGRLLCVVARVQDLIAIERCGVMRGRYFVLGKLLSPLDGIGPDELPLPALDAKLRADGVEEVILATPPSVDGEATALLLGRELAHRGIRVSRIASGVPHGGDLEFADQITLGRAIEGRRNVDSVG
ncbi:MAG: recombination protein RecR [Myxococcales bacterium]|jgi:recombination protein RecR|nr:recombination protein RecR [Myxococcales bacterium]